MSKCLAFAWLSPELAILDIDRDRYRTICIQDPKDRGNLDLFLAAQDKRAAVVLVDGVSALARVADVEGVKAFLLFDTVTACRSVVGAQILDQQEGRDDCAIKRFDMTHLHAHIDGPDVPFMVPQSALQVSQTLAAKITLSDLMAKLKRKEPAIVTDDFVFQTCSRIVGRLRKSTWVSKVRKVALAEGMDTQVLAELERFVEDGSVSEGLWRGFFDLVELQVPIEDVEKRYDVRRQDLEYLVSILGPEAIGEANYASPPTSKKKRA